MAQQPSNINFSGHWWCPLSVSPSRGEAKSAGRTQEHKGSPPLNLPPQGGEAGRPTQATQASPQAGGCAWGQVEDLALCETHCAFQLAELGRTV